jgi:hypothetical protein
MRQFGKVRAPRIYFVAKVHKHTRGIFSIEMCSYKDSVRGPLIDMGWTVLNDWHLFTVRWRWE